MALDVERFIALRREAVSVLKKLPDGSIDAFVTDPPYGIELCLHTIPGRDTRIAGDGKAEAREGRRFLGVEIDPRHHKLGLRRLQDAAAEMNR